MKRQTCRTWPVLLLAGVSVVMGGCQLVGVLLGTEERVRAEHTLADRPTLVMAEDPGDALGDPALVGVLARSVENHLRDKQVLDEAPLIAQSELRAVADELGDEYARAPIDRIGRLAGAEQVIHVTVRAVRMSRAMNVYEPTAELEVKVIDAANSRRLFPEAASFEADGEPSPGHRLTAQMDVSTMDHVDQGTQAVVSRQLAEHAGLAVARLFYNWRK